MYTGNIGDNIDLFNGTLTLSQTDLSLPGRAGLNLHLTRVYSSNIFEGMYLEDTADCTIGNTTKPRYVGQGWTLQIGRVFDSTVYYGDGSAEKLFVNSSPGSSKFPMRTVSGNRFIIDGDTVGSNDTLVMLSGTMYVYGDRYSYAQGVLDSLYGGEYVKEIVDVFGNSIQIAYHDDWPYIDSITDAVGRTVWFEYDTSPASFTDSTKLVRLKYLNHLGTDTLYVSYGSVPFQSLPDRIGLRVKVYFG
jgi:hypothetical protein